VRVGFNYPWAFDDYGRNFGPTFDPPKWASTLPDNLALLKNLGVSVIRWFILANASNYGPTPTLTQTSDGEFTGTFNPPVLADTTFRDQFNLLLKTILDSVTGIQLIPSFVDFQIAGEVHPPREDGTGGTGGSGRADLIRDPAKRDLFFQTMLDPLLDVASQQQFRSIIFAFEVMNEPAWLVRRISKPIFTDLLPRGPKIEPKLLKDFLRIALQRIKSAGLESTVGHRFASDLNDFGPGLAGTVPQFHYYPRNLGFPVDFFSDSPTLPSFESTQAVLGEFSTRDDTEQGDPWRNDCHGSDETPFSRVSERLKVAQSKGYQLAMLWPDLRDDGKDSLKLSPIKQRAVKSFANPFF
jgi:hypothetical protein